MARKKKQSEHERVLLNATYELDGVIVLDGPDMRALFGSEEYKNVKTGLELANMGLSVRTIAKLIDEDYLIPVTDQPLVESALRQMLNGSRSSPTGSAQKVS